MISKNIEPRKDGISSALDAIKYGVGLKIDKGTGEWLDKSYRTRFQCFGLIDNGVYFDRDPDSMITTVDKAALEMQTILDLSTKVDQKNKLGHFVFSFGQEKPSEAVLLDTEDSMRKALKLSENHFVSCLHNDNGHWHLHIFVSRIEKQKPFRGNSLWRDRTLRDLVCREIEERHNLRRDNGLHEIDANGIMTEVPLQLRIARRESNSNPNQLSDRALSLEKITGQQSFQSWCNEVRIGDRLIHAKSWKEMHHAATAYQCQIKQRGAGYVICPIEGKGGLPISKVGITKVQQRLGPFVPIDSEAKEASVESSLKYSSKSIIDDGLFFDEWRSKKSGFSKFRQEKWAEFRETATKRRNAILSQYKTDLAEIRSTKSGISAVAARSVVQINHAAKLTEFASIIRQEKQLLKVDITARQPGTNYREYLFNLAKENDIALETLRGHSAKHSTNVSRESEWAELKIISTFAGNNEHPIRRLPIKHLVLDNGTVVYDLGENRSILDSAIAKQIQLNSAAANDVDSVEIALRFSISKFGHEISLSGPQSFQNMVVEIAVRNGLTVNFTDPVLEKLRTDLSMKKNPIKPQRETHHHVKRIGTSRRAKNISRTR
ncbi:TraI/MobA(P) family conjugative relaxase [Sapientia aquatica]|uniref:Uncharacterized protein n=1 Tax=Sapientia aquatica TaxID=1549640 RepID=A0A4R5VRC0_9BURK|nr:TraI/MobA(P) family conjugative relaxase [Sapientia aquatica]TDK61215.1 hypothetical protein E2I14_17675 [Sapientia aquatica]